MNIYHLTVSMNSSCVGFMLMGAIELYLAVHLSYVIVLPFFLFPLCCYIMYSNLTLSYLLDFPRALLKYLYIVIGSRFVQIC